MTTLAEALESNRREAERQRTIGRMKLQWELDSLGLLCGTVEIVPREDDEVIMRRSLRRSVEDTFDDPRPARIIPRGRDEHGQNWCLMVRDVV